MAAVLTQAGARALLRYTEPGRAARRRVRRDRPSSAAARRRKVHGVSVTIVDTRDHWLVSVVPGPELRDTGIREHASRVRKCGCDPIGRVVLASGRCRACRGMDALGVAGYQLRLLKAYPKITVTERADGGR
jgi:hypothetical protein